MSQGKLIFILAVVGIEILVYLILSVTVSFVSQIAVDTANNTAVTPFASAQGFLRWVPILLYIVPAAIGLVAIFLRLRKDDEAE
jgi:cytochrome c oxidase subunit IV